MIGFALQLQMTPQPLPATGLHTTIPGSAAFSSGNVGGQLPASAVATTIEVIMAILAVE